MSILTFFYASDADYPLFVVAYTLSFFFWLVAVYAKPRRDFTYFTTGIWFGLGILSITLILAERRTDYFIIPCALLYFVWRGISAIWLLT
jgi:hypothetical protein